MSTQETPENMPAAPVDRSHEPPQVQPPQVQPQREPHSEDPQPGNQAAAGSKPEHAGGDGSEAKQPSGDREPGQAQAQPDGTPSQAQAQPDGTPGLGAPGTGKRKRRRRRKKPQGEGASAAGEAGASADGEQGDDDAGEGGEDGTGSADDGTETKADGTQGPRGPGGPNANRGKKKNDRPRRERGAEHHGPGAGAGPARERTPFNLGDVVFGKIVAITDDALFIDLSGKANAIFDRREMDMPEEPANTPAPAEEEEDPPGTVVVPKALLGKKAHIAPAPESVPDSVSDAPTATEMPEDFAAFHAASVAAGASTAAASGNGSGTGDVVSPVAASAETASTSDVNDAAAPPAAPDPPAYLPPIVLEVGANFVGVVHNDGSRGGLVVLTRHPRRAPKSKPMVLNAFKEKDNNVTVTGLVTGVIKGGVEVDIEGLRAFAPGSHMDLRLGADLHHHVGERLVFTVTQYGKKGRDIVLSRRKMLDGEAKANREALLSKLEIGSVVEGVVKSVVAFGAFIDVGGVEGLVPLQEMSHNRSDGPTDCFTPGETVKIKIIRVDERGKIWLSRKATITDPWVEATKKYTVGSRHAGKVVRLQPFGVFVELEEGIDGLIHAADLSIKRFEHPSEIVKVGDPIDVVVAGVDGGMHKIGLHPAPTGAAADEPHQRVQVHKMLKVAVVAIDPGGLVVRVLGATGRHARGFIPAGATGTARGTELRKIFPIGKELEAKVIDLDPKRGEVKLSIKAMNEDTERNAYKAYQQQVKREAKFGTFGDLLSKKLGKE